jgi:hypothetical protein
MAQALLTKVEEKADVQTTGLQIGQHLRLMDWRKLAERF